MTDKTEKAFPEGDHKACARDRSRPYLLNIPSLVNGPFDQEGEKKSGILMRWYKEGKPFFTKQMLESFSKQFDNFRPGPDPQEFQLLSIDGQTHTITIPGQEESKGKETIDIRGRLVTEYRAFQDLYGGYTFYSRSYPFCSMSVFQQITPHFTATGDACYKAEVYPEADVRMRFRKICIVSEKSEPSQRLRKILAPSTLPKKITKIVAFACGEMALHKYDGVNRPFYQHALILVLRDIFSPPSSPIPCYVQDPAYTQTDIDILASHSITVLPDPKGFLEVDSNTLIVSFAPNVCVKQIIADIARPAAIIWDKIDLDMEKMQKELTKATFTDPSSPRVIEMLMNEYEHREWLDDQCEQWEGEFGPAAVYVNKKVEVGEEKAEEEYLITGC